MDTVFQLASLLVMPFWALMIFAPGWRWTDRIVASPWIVAGPSVVYAVLALPALGGLLPALANPQLAQIAELLGRPEGALLAWMHFLAFDLFVGRRVYLDARKHLISKWISGPVLGLVLMLGPLGLLSWLAVRALRQPPARSAA